MSLNFRILFIFSALQTLFLFAKSIDSNVTFSKFVIDSWIEIRLPNVDQGQKALVKALTLRSMWLNLLNAKLTDDESVDKDLLQNKLAKGLLDFLHTEVMFSIRRLLPGDLKVAFSGPGNGQDVEIDENPFRHEIKPNETKGGMSLSDYFTYNSLVNTAEDYQENLVQYDCDICQESLYASQYQKFCHFALCYAKEEAVKNEQEETERKKYDPNSREYFCPDCDKTLYLTSTEILRHSRGHTK